MEERQISKAVIKRLPRYYRYLGEILDSGMERISSGELSSRMKVTASQIRQDLNHFGGFGQQGYGYNVKYLHDEIGKILGETQLNALTAKYPDKEFCVFVTVDIGESMIIRFHQVWKNEPPYYNPDDFNSDKTKVLMFRK